MNYIKKCSILYENDFLCFEVKVCNYSAEYALICLASL